MRKALTERRELIEQRAEAVLDQALTERQEWALALGDAPPSESRGSVAAASATVAAYRDRYGITTRTPLGPAPDSDAQKIDAARAKPLSRDSATSRVSKGTTIRRGLRGVRREPGL
jgi:hypothetical protein